MIQQSLEKPVVNPELDSSMPVENVSSKIRSNIKIDLASVKFKLIEDTSKFLGLGEIIKNGQRWFACPYDCPYINQKLQSAQQHKQVRRLT